MRTKIVIVFLLVISLCATNINAQRFTQEMRGAFLERAMHNKIRMNTNKILAHPELLKNLEQEQQQRIKNVLTKKTNQGNNITNTPETESEIHAAINPVDSNNIIVGAMRWTSSNFGSALSFPIYYTRDFGDTWQTAKFDGMERSFINVGGGDPVISFDTEGIAYLTWLTVDLGFSPLIGITLHWATSTDGGATWSYGEDVVDQGAILDLFGSSGQRLVDKEWTAVDISDSPYRNNFYIAYAEINVVDTTYQILLKKKTPEANRLSEAVRVSPEDVLFAQFSSIDVDSEGGIHVLYMGATAQDTLFGMYHSYSEDGGESFQQTRITNVIVPCLFEEEACDIVGIDEGRMYPCPHLKVDRSGGEYDGRVYIVWTAVGTNFEASEGADIYYTYSDDKGITWETPIILNNDTSSTTHQFFPNLIVNDRGILSISWYDRREDDNNVDTQHYMTYSIDGGKTFVDDFSVSQKASDFTQIGLRNGNFGVGEYTQIVSSSNYAIPFWADGRTNDGNIEIYMAKIPLNDSISSNNLGSIESFKSISSPLEMISPNPTNGELSITLNLETSEDVIIEIYSNSGQKVMRQKRKEMNEGKHSLSLDIHHLPSGIYQLKIQTPTSIHVSQVVLND
jgi:hypothetical protein